MKRLTAIMAADVAGYTRLMGEDEARALSAMAELRETFFEPIVAERNGTILKRLGDGWLVEFPNVADAVACAIDVQTGLRDHHLIRLRVGIHIGDITFQEQDIYGDGVNIAARLEALATPGQVVISDTAHHSLDGKAKAQFGAGGSRHLKNVKRAVDIWQWPADAAKETPDTEKFGSVTPPRKPSVAVMPFDNISNDPEQEFFADGMTEDIITGLSRYRSMFVIARNSTFSYKGQSPDLRKVSRELGVRYLLEGSIRKAGQRVRITAQLIEGQSGNHIWAERYDRELDDIFAVQDEITETIVAAIAPEVDTAERESARRLAPDDLGAWESYQRGLWHMYRFNKQDNAEAQRLFRAAAERSDNFAPAFSGLTHALYYALVHDYVDDPAATMADAIAAGRQAVAADMRDADAHFALGRVLYQSRDFTNSIAELETAVRCNPSFAHAYLGLGGAYYYTDAFEPAIECLDRAVRLSPNDPLLWVVHTIKAGVLFLQGRYDEAEPFARMATQDPAAAVTAFMTLGMILGHLGRKEDAKPVLEEIHRRKSDFTEDFVRRCLPFRNTAHHDHINAGLRKAGILR